MIMVTHGAWYVTLISRDNVITNNVRERSLGCQPLNFFIIWRVCFHSHNPNMRNWSRLSCFYVMDIQMTSRHGTAFCRITGPLWGESFDESYSKRPVVRSSEDFFAVDRNEPCDRKSNCRFEVPWRSYDVIIISAVSDKYPFAIAYSIGQYHEIHTVSGTSFIEMCFEYDARICFRARSFSLHPFLCYKFPCINFYGFWHKWKA